MRGNAPKLLPWGHVEVLSESVRIFPALGLEKNRTVASGVERGSVLVLTSLPNSQRQAFGWDVSVLGTGNH